MAAPDSKNPNLTFDTLAFIKGLEAQGGPPLYTLSPEQARQVLVKVQSGPAPRPDVHIEDVALAAGPTGSVDVRIVRPKSGTTGALPVIFYFHGGGWILGDKTTHDRLVRELCCGTGAAVAYVNYTPSPEAQYPVPIEQAYGAYELMVKNAADFGFDHTRFALAGDSVGGNMATVVAMLAKDRKGPKARFQLLLYPVTDARMDNGSYKAFADGPWLTKKAMEWFWDAYLPDKSKRNQPTASPLLAPVDMLRDLPDALIITDENDVLRDEGEAYAVKLDEAGVKVVCVRVNGTIHDFAMLNALAETGAARSAVALSIMALKTALA